MSIGLSLAALVACKSKDKDKAGSGTGNQAGTGSQAGTAQPAPPDAAPAAAAPDAAPRAAALDARADGVGPLVADTEASVPALLKLLPDYTIKQVNRPHGGDLEEEYYAIIQGDHDVLHIQHTGTTLTAVDVVGPGVSNSLGIDLGMSFTDVATKLGELDCVNGGDEIDWRADVVVCTTDKADTYTLDFVAAEGEGLSAADLLDDPDQMGRATLRAITWQAVTGPPGQ